MKNFSIEFKWAVNFSITTLLWMILEKSIGLHDVMISDHMLYSNFFSIPAIAIYFFALLDKKKNFYHGIIDWKQGFISGLLLSFFIAILSPLVQYITFTFISPDFFANFTQYAVQQKSLNLEQAQAYYSMNSYILQGVSGALSMGVITSAIVALIIKTKKTKLMKIRHIFLLLLSVLLVSCVSTKSTIKNIDDNAPIPKLTAENTFVITAYSEDKKYGYDPDYPINVFFRNTKDQTINQQRFLNALAGPKGEKLLYKNSKPVVLFLQKRSDMGAGFLDVYEITWEGNKTPLKLYFNIYEKALLVPIGLKLK